MPSWRASIQRRFACVARGARVSTRKAIGWRVAIDMGGSEMFDAVIVATPANVAGALLEGVDRDLADDLLGITYSSSVTVTLGYHMDQLKHLPPGFGFLVPRSEGRRMLACTFVHNKFPHRAPANKGILRCFLGGARDEAVLNLTDEEILDTVRAELKEIVKLDARPMFEPRLSLAGRDGAVRVGTYRADRAHRKARQGNPWSGARGQCVSRYRRA